MRKDYYKKKTGHNQSKIQNHDITISNLYICTPTDEMRLSLWQCNTFPSCLLIFLPFTGWQIAYCTHSCSWLSLWQLKVYKMWTGYSAVQEPSQKNKASLSKQLWTALLLPSTLLAHFFFIMITDYLSCQIFFEALQTNHNYLYIAYSWK